MKKFVILISVYNDWKSVFKLIENIDIQISNWEAAVSVIIVNDASTDSKPQTELNRKKIKSVRVRNMKKNGTSAILGGALTAFTPGCPACTTSLSAVLGIVGGLAIFPLQGLELKLISVAALTFSIWWAMRNINNATCCVMKE